MESLSGNTQSPAGGFPVSPAGVTLPRQGDCTELSPKGSSHPSYSVRPYKHVIKFSTVSRMLPTVSLAASTGLMALFM